MEDLVNPTRTLAALTLLALARSAHATNYLVIVADDLGADSLEVEMGADDAFNWGGTSTWADTPALDSLAAAGLAMDLAWANPSCSPTRSTLHTGNHAFYNWIGRPLPNGQELGRDDPGNLPFALVDADPSYTTGLFGKWHLGSSGSSGWNSEISTYSALPDPWPWHVTTGVPAPVYQGGYDTVDGYAQLTTYVDWIRIWQDVANTRWVVEDEATYVDESTVVAATAWIGAQTTPWLAVVALSAPHDSPSGYSEKDVHADTDCDALSLMDDCFDDPYDGDTCSDDEAYRGFVTCMDERVGDFLAGLDLSDTLIFFVGDNGTPQSVMQGPYTNPTHAVGKLSTYQSGVRVPMILADGDAYEGNSATLITSPGRLVTAPVQVTDIYATIIDHANGGAAAPAVEGDSLVGCLSNTTASTCGLPTNRVLYSEEFLMSPPTSTTTLSEGSATVQVGTMKMIATYDPTPGCMDTELFDVAPGVDPHEETDLEPTTSSLVCRAYRSRFEAVAPTWMPDGASPGETDIVWCGTSC